ncbi:MAG: hypothetical protein HEEMFOPI_00513 [Holosporales bacterium]
MNIKIIGNQKKVKILKSLALAAILQFTLTDSILFASTVAVNPSATFKAAKPLKKDPLDFIRPQLNKIKDAKDQIAQAEKDFSDSQSAYQTKKQALEADVTATIEQVAQTLTTKQNTSRGNLFQFVKNPQDQADFSQHLNELSKVLPGYKALLKQLSTKENSLKGQNSSIKTLEADRAKNEAALVQLNDQYSQAQAQYDQHASMNAQNKAQRDALKNQIDELSKQIAAETANSSLEKGRIDSLNNETIPAAQKSLVAMNSVTDNKRKNLPDFRKRKADLEKLIADATAQVQEKQNLVQTSDAKVAELSAQKTQLQTQFDSVADASTVKAYHSLSEYEHNIFETQMNISVATQNIEKQKRKTQRTENDIQKFKGQVEEARKGVMEHYKPIINILSGIPFVPEASDNDQNNFPEIDKILTEAKNIASDPMTDDATLDPANIGGSEGTATSDPLVVDASPVGSSADSSGSVSPVGSSVDSSGSVSPVENSPGNSESDDEPLNKSFNNKLLTNNSITLPPVPNNSLASPTFLKKEKDANKFLSSIMSSPTRCSQIVTAYKEYNDAGQRVLLAYLNANKSLLNTYRTISAKDFKVPNPVSNICK